MEDLKGSHKNVLQPLKLEAYYCPFFVAWPRASGVRSYLLSTISPWYGPKLLPSCVREAQGGAATVRSQIFDANLPKYAATIPPPTQQSNLSLHVQKLLFATEIDTLSFIIIVLVGNVLWK